MSIFLGILLTFFVFLVVVLVHEFGHFITARLTGMKVLEFGFGIPPKLFRLFRDKKGTDYTFNALPIGGFVRIKGENPLSLEALDPDSFIQKTWWKRCIVLIAGVTMNFLLSIGILTIFFSVGTQPIAPNFLSKNEYKSVLLPSIDESVKSGYLVHSGIELHPLTGSLAEKSGILPGDILIAVDDVLVTKPQIFIDKIKQNKPTILLLSGTGGSRTLTITPENGKIGTYIGYKDISVNTDYQIQYSPLRSLSIAIVETYRLSYMTLDMLWTTLSNLIVPATPKDREEAKSVISGPIGMGSQFISLVDVGVTWQMIWMIIAMISINLGVFNLLPFPALDGGRIVSTTLYSIVGKFTKNKTKIAHIEAVINTGGMILLLGVSLGVAFMDISKFF